MRIYRVTIIGTRNLLLHADNIEWDDEMETWRANKDNKKSSKPGDDRSPAWRWLGGVYHDDVYAIMPADNLMRCWMEAGAKVPVPGSARKTFKSQSQSGIIPKEIGWPIYVGGKPLKWAPFAKMVGVKDFAKHKQFALDLGGQLFVKRVKIGKSKHVRVRLRLPEWQVICEFGVSDEQITTQIFTDIIETGGHLVGLCDWRPGAPTPGSHGMFSTIVEQLGEA